MAIRDVNVMSIINQELAKMDRRGGSRDYVDVVSETMRYAEEHRKRKAERSEDAMKIMSVTAGNYNADYENSSIEENIKRLDTYMDQNKNKLDATAIDYYQVTKNAMEDQIKSNTDFNTMESRLLGKNKEMADFVNGLDRSDQIGTDEIQQIKDMNMGWIKYTSDFQRKHGDRLNRNLYTNLRGQLGQSAKINSFLLEQARDDNWLSEDEYVAWRSAWEDLSIDPITEFNKKEDNQRDLSSRVLQGQINEVMSEYSKYQNFLSGAGTMKINDQELFLNQLMEEEKETYKQQAGTMISTMSAKLGDLDKRYMHLDNNSFVENYLPNFYSKTPITTPTPQTTPPGEIIGDTGTKTAKPKVKSVTVDTGQDAEDVLLGFIKGDISKDILKNIGGHSLVNKAGRIKDAYKGEYAGRKKYKGKPVSDIENLKELKYGSYKDKYSWDDVVGEIYDTKRSGASILEDYLGGNISINNLNLAYRTRRGGAEKIKKDFEKLGITISEYKSQYPNKYNKLVNILSKASLKKG